MEQRVTYFAEVETLPQEFSGNILSARNIFIAESFYGLLALNMLCGIGLFCWGGFILLSAHAPQGEMVLTTKTMGIILLSIGILLYGISYVFNPKKNDFLPNLWLRHVAQREVACRPDKLVDPNHPDSHFVAVVPRATWDKHTWGNVKDVGFLSVDHQKGLVLFEGDSERYRIPMQAIAKYQRDCCLHFLESYIASFPGYGSIHYSEKRLFFVVLSVKLREQHLELPFRILTGSTISNQSKQSKATQELLAEINQLKA
jgi:hypothetical protein